MIDKGTIESIAHQFLIAIGEDPTREGLVDTPMRVAQMCEELFSTNNSPHQYTTFAADNYNGMIVVRNISFSSLCEHHLLPFIGRASIAYFPSKKLLGLSKVVRIIETKSKKLQLQERLTTEIIDEIHAQTESKGIAVYLEAEHTCMTIRGVKKSESRTVTVRYSGCFEIDADLQNKFLHIIKPNNRR
jgi:GTP cyclohydrolase I